MDNCSELIDRYVAVWNEPDAERRRTAIAALWVEDGAHINQNLEARGYAAIEARVTGAHERFVATGGYTFRPTTNMAAHHNVVKFTWEMMPAGGGAVEAAGTHFFVLADDGRIRFDYQFPEPVPAS